MPLLICISFFALLFAVEYAWYQACLVEREHALVRYARNEHPLRLTSDLYIDALS